MDRSHTPSVIQGDVELHDISTSPSVEMCRLLTPSLPDDKLQGEMSLDFDSSCNAHDSVLGSSFPLGRETDVNMGEDECLDLSVTPSFETGLSDYAPTCFDSGTITHSIHTHPVCAVAESTSSFVGKDGRGDRSQQDAPQILSASPFILGSTSAANFVNAVWENLSSRSTNVLHPTTSIFSVAPGIFILNTMGTPGIIDLPLRTNLPLADIAPCVSVAMSTAPLGYEQSEIQPLGNRDSSGLNSLVSPKIINLEIRTVPINEQFPVVVCNDGSTVMPSTVNLPTHIIPQCFSENQSSSSSYLTFDTDMALSMSGMSADSSVQLEDKKFSLDETYCHMVRENLRETTVNNLEIQTPPEICSESQKVNSYVEEKALTENTCVEAHMERYTPIVKKEMNLETIQHGEEGHYNDPVACNLMCSVENNWGSNLNRSFTFSVKSDDENTKNLTDSIIHFSTNVQSGSVENTNNHNCIKLEDTVSYDSYCKVAEDWQLNSSKLIPKNITYIYKERDFDDINRDTKNFQIEPVGSASVEVNSSELNTSTISDNPTPVASSTHIPREEEDGTSDQLSWDRSSDGKILQTINMDTRKGEENNEITEVDYQEVNTSKSGSTFQNNIELKFDASGKNTPVLETISQHNMPKEESTVDEDESDELSILLPDKDDLLPGQSEVQVNDEGGGLMACTLESTDNVCEQEPEQTTETTINVCELCNATFTRIGNYKRHLKLHDFKLWNNNRYKCDKCDRLFLQHCDLKRHALIHDNREPYKCSVCGKGYIRKSDLVVHLRFHNKEKAFKCDRCTKSYYQNGDLKRHMRTHTKPELLTCAYCGRKLARQTTLLQHMQTKHKDIIIETFQNVEKHKQKEDLAT